MTKVNFINDNNFTDINSWLDDVIAVGKNLQPGAMLEVGKVQFVSGKIVTFTVHKGGELHEYGYPCWMSINRIYDNVTHVSLVASKEDKHDVVEDEENTLYEKIVADIYPYIIRLFHQVNWINDMFRVVNQNRTSENLILTPKVVLKDFTTPQGKHMKIEMDKGFLTITRHDKTMVSKTLSTIVIKQEENKWFTGTMLEQFLFGWMDGNPYPAI